MITLNYFWVAVIISIFGFLLALALGGDDD